MNKEKWELVIASMILGGILTLGGIWGLDHSISDYYTYDFTVVSKIGENKYLITFIEGSQYSWKPPVEMKFIHEIELTEGEIYKLTVGKTWWGNYKLFKEY